MTAREARPAVGMPAVDDPRPSDHRIGGSGWERRRRKRALADHVRALAADVLMLDVDAAEGTDLDLAEEQFLVLRSQLAAMPDLRGVGLHQSPHDASLFERSPVVGRCNAHAVPLEVWVEGDLTRGYANYGDAYEGPPGRVHGGYVVAAFDDLLGVAQAAAGVAGFTGSLTVRLSAATPLKAPIDYEARVLSVRGRKVVVSGRSFCRGVLLAEAEGTFIEPANHPGTMFNALTGDLAGLAAERDNERALVQ